MVYTVFYKTSSFAGYCFLDKNSIHPKRYGVFSFKAFIAVLVKIQICSFIVNDLPVLRARIGISQEDIAAKIGVSRQTYNSYEVKKRPIPWSVCIALITFFNSNSKTREMMKNNTYLLELMDEIFG